MISFQTQKTFPRSLAVSVVSQFVSFFVLLITSSYENSLVQIDLKRFHGILATMHIFRLFFELAEEGFRLKKRLIVFSAKSTKWVKKRA